MSDSGVHAVAGSLGGMLAMTVTYPLINISTKAQVETRKSDESSITVIKRALERDGLASLFQGLDSSLVAIGVTNFVYYFCFEEARHILLNIKKSKSKLNSATLSTLESILASTVSGIATSLCVNPIWVVNTRQISQKSSADKQRLSFLGTFKHILDTEGPSALMRGLGPALVLVINPILQYTSFEQLKNLLVARRLAALPTQTIRGTAGSILDRPAQLPLSDIDYFLLGALSKLFATGLTYPYLTLKSRMQAGQSTDTSTFSALHRIFRDEGGIKALYRGVLPKLTQSVLMSAILFASKERLYQYTKSLILRYAAFKTGQRNLAKA